MKRFRLNFRRSSSDRKAERSLKAVFYRRLSWAVTLPQRAKTHLFSKFPYRNDKIPSGLTKPVSSLPIQKHESKKPTP